MTKTRYLIARLLQSFGIERKNKRLADAALEMHLMTDGEELLGGQCWQNITDIEELSVEYWELRRLSDEALELQQKISEAESILLEAQQNRAQIVGTSAGQNQNNQSKREQTYLKFDQLNKKRDSMMTEATVVRRKHDALKLQIQVLEKDPDAADEINTCREKLETVKEKFQHYKAEIDKINTKIKNEQLTLNDIQSEKRDKVHTPSNEVNESFVKISDANRQITHHQAKLGVINDRQAVLHRTVGRYLNQNAKRPDCKKACARHRSLLIQTQLLASSSKLNRALGGR